MHLPASLYVTQSDIDRMADTSETFTFCTVNPPFAAFHKMLRSAVTAYCVNLENLYTEPSDIGGVLSFKFSKDANGDIRIDAVFDDGCNWKDENLRNDFNIAILSRDFELAKTLRIFSQESK